MNASCLRQVHSSTRQEYFRTIEEERARLFVERAQAQSELAFAVEHCPNRVGALRAKLDDLSGRIDTDRMRVFDEACAPYMEKIDELSPNELDSFLRVMGVVYKSTSVQQQSNNGGAVETGANDLYVCSKCDEVRVCDEFEAFSVCMKCGHALPFHKDTGDAGETLQYTMQFEYDRVNHFRECLNQIIKAVENVPSIDRKVFRFIKRQIIKERITNRAMITRRRIKDWLKRDKSMNKYSERVFSILYAVCKIRPPKISKALEQKFYEMFHDIQKPFSKHVPAGRTHFFNYSFILRKFCELLGQDQLVPVFDILKGVDRVHFQDEIWKRCCAEKGWKFIPSI